MTDHEGTGLSAHPDGAQGGEQGTGTEENMRVGVQVVAALAMGAVLFGGLLVLQHHEQAAKKPAAAAACKAPAADDSPEYPVLCAALNRPDLPALVGSPMDRVTEAGPGAHWTNSDGTKEVDKSAELQIGQISLRLTDDDDMDVTDAEILGSAAHHRSSVRGHLSTTYQMDTIGISFSLGGGSSSRAPNGVADNLVIGKHPDGHGGSYELAIWRQDTAPPDEASLYRIAEAVLPNLPGWVAGTAAQTAPSAPPASPPPATGARTGTEAGTVTITGTDPWTDSGMDQGAEAPAGAAQ
ncbi:DUF6215 domain-containing protein [Kitasatospora sp. LaBMicrA B282]|uniref:DUF6215 domain-containing protein n=1 Tax=Kitasatospora sp. LaBMicrA B282 TaxID=3420949 RepID=UPI003D0AC7A8